VPMTRWGLVPALGRGQLQELARYKLPLLFFGVGFAGSASLRASPRPPASRGRPASMDAARVRALKAQGMGATKIANELCIGRAGVYRVLEAGTH
jgi:Helix-turn-helix domain of resolvase